MRRHGYKGAFEMAATVDYLFGYDATAGVMADWMYEQLTQQYVLDPENRKFMSESNPLGSARHVRTLARGRGPRRGRTPIRRRSTGCGRCSWKRKAISKAVRDRCIPGSLHLWICP